MKTHSTWKTYLYFILQLFSCLSNTAGYVFLINLLKHTVPLNIDGGELNKVSNIEEFAYSY
jgi:hypothetical protein